MNALLLALSGKFPMWEECVSHNLKYVDIVIVRVDANGFSKDLEQRLAELVKGKQFAGYVSNTPMTKANWREELLTILHHQKLDIDYVFFPDEDEKIILNEDLDKDGQYMFDYEMVTNGHKAYKYPALPHAKVYKYHPQLTYNPYFSFARVTKDGRVYKEVKAKGVIQHYCFYEEEWMERKEQSILERYPDYFDKFPKEYSFE